MKWQFNFGFSFPGVRPLAGPQRVLSLFGRKRLVFSRMHQWPTEEKLNLLCQPLKFFCRSWCSWHSRPLWIPDVFPLFQVELLSWFKPKKPQLDRKSLPKLLAHDAKQKNVSSPPRWPRLFLFHDAHQYLTDLFFCLTAVFRLNRIVNSSPDSPSIGYRINDSTGRRNCT